MDNLYVLGTSKWYRCNLNLEVTLRIDVIRQDRSEINITDMLKADFICNAIEKQEAYSSSNDWIILLSKTIIVKLQVTIKIIVIERPFWEFKLLVEKYEYKYNQVLYRTTLAKL